LLDGHSFVLIYHETFKSLHILFAASSNPSNAATWMAASSFTAISNTGASGKLWMILEQ